MEADLNNLTKLEDMRLGPRKMLIYSDEPGSGKTIVLSAIAAQANQRRRHASLPDAEVQDRSNGGGELAAAPGDAGQ